MIRKPHNVSSPARLPFHYGWVIMVTGTLCIFACLGLGRFSLGMLLPSMGKSLQLSYSEMGFISTANFIGYLVAVLISSRVMSAIGARYCITIALIVVGLSMICISTVHTIWAITLFYILTGMGSAMANVPIMALISMWFSNNSRGKAAGFVVIGSGFAILLCGRLVPYLNTFYTEGWRVNWLVLGSIVLFCSLICYTLLRNTPSEMGLDKVGISKEEKDAQKSEFQREPISVHSRIVYHIGAIYFLFGFTYVIYVTFVVTSMVQDRGFAESAAGIFWSWVGLLSLVSGPIPGAISDKLGRKTALIMVFIIQALAYLLVAMPLSNTFLFLSILCYGSVAWAVPSIISALVADYTSGQRIAAIFGFVTFIFGLGQISGPYLAGVIAEKTGHFSGSFLLACIMAVAAVLLSSLLPSKKG